MDMKDFAWDYFSKSGSLEAYLLFKEEDEYHKKAGSTGVCEYPGCSDKGNKGRGQ